MKKSFIHTADIHLGRPFSDLPEIDGISQVCDNACKEAFNNIINLAIERNVDFVLFAGDNFDSDEQDLSTKLLFIKGLKKLADNGIASYVICGNHDPAQLYRQNAGYFKFEDKYKDLIHITGVTEEELQKDYEIDGVTIHTLSFETDTAGNPTESLTEKTDKNFNIGLIHCDVDKTDSKYAPCAKEDLRKLGYDYYALGHIHIPTELEDGMVYAGSHQSRTKKEVGAHGCYYVEIEDNKIAKTEFVPTDCVRFNSVSLDCSEYDTAEEVFENIKTLAEDNAVDVKLNLFEVTLSGVSNAYEQIAECENLLEEYNKVTEYDSNDNVKIYRINNELSPDVDEEELLKDQGVVGILANAFSEKSDINIENIYEKVAEIHNNIYKKLKVDDDTKDALKSSLTDDKEEILLKVKNDIKSMCKEIYLAEK